MTDCGELLRELEKDHMARLRHVVLAKLGVFPLGLRARMISDRKILEYACHMVLDKGGSGGGSSFDMDKFIRMKEGEA